MGGGAVPLSPPPSLTTTPAPPGPPAALLLSTRHELRRLALDGSSYRRLRGTPGHAAALAADLAAGTVYWADRSRGTIYR